MLFSDAQSDHEFSRSDLVVLVLVRPIKLLLRKADSELVSSSFELASGMAMAAVVPSKSCVDRLTSTISHLQGRARGIAMLLIAANA